LFAINEINWTINKTLTKPENIWNVCF
jgi:hypothetical protein